ncbi:MAG: TolC family outer membrane protein [Candidatus Sedimenticola sp. (ex Thyasira tokunagai)]
MHFKLKWTKALVGTAGVVAALAGVSASALTLEESVQTALKSYPSIQKAQAARMAIEGDLGVANSRFRPTIDLALGYGREYSNNPTTRAIGLAANKEGRYLARQEASITLTQVLFDGYSRDSEVEKQSALLKGAGYDIRDEAETVAADVAFAYIDILRYLEILRLSEENLEVHSKILDNVKKRVDAGQSGVADLQQATARQASAKSRIAEVRLDLDKAEIAFNRLVGIEADELTKPEFAANMLPSDLDMAVQMASESSPLVERSRSEAASAKADIGNARAGNYPTVLFELRGSDNHDLDGSSGINKDMTAMVRLNMNLYRGGADKAREQAASSRHGESMAGLAQSQRQVEEEVRRAWSAMERQDEEVMGRFDQVLANGQVVDTYREEFDVGQRDLLDLLDSENELFVSRTQLVSAESSALYARYLVVASMGQLVEGLGATLPEAGQ